MEEADKLPLKRVEISLTKFNEVAIPHHLDLLRQHKANIIKCEANGDWARVRSEQTRARRVAAQLRALLGELNALRRRVRAVDLLRFDALTQHAQDLTLAAIVDYLETSPVSVPGAPRDELAPGAAGSAVSTDSVGVVAHAQRGERAGSAPRDLALVQLQVDPQESALQEREAVLRGWSELQSEVHALHEAWGLVHGAAVAQRAQLAEVLSSVETAADNVHAARAELSTAEKIRAGAYGIGGAAIGALVGGPVGLVVGAKAGAVALVAGSFLGYIGARVLGRRRQLQLEAPPEPNKKED